jgi:hypothetical protein
MSRSLSTSRTPPPTQLWTSARPRRRRWHCSGQARPLHVGAPACATFRAGGEPLRPVVKTALRRLWRDSTTLQIGVHHERAVVVAGIGEQVGRLLAAFDGAHDRSALRARARSLGLDASIVDRLVSMLTEAAVLDDAATDARPLAALPRVERDRLAPDLASMSLVSGQLDGGLSTVSRRQRATVGVVGGGRVGGAVATLLGAAGIGHLVVEDAETCRPADCGPAGAAIGDTGSTRAQAAHASIHRISQITRTTALTPAERYDVVVLATGGVPEMTAINELVRSGVPHLRVVVKEAIAVVGPFVIPGTTSCLRCLELQRSDRDSAWPVIAAQWPQVARAQVPKHATSSWRHWPRPSPHCKCWRSSTAAIPSPATEHWKSRCPTGGCGEGVGARTRCAAAAGPTRRCSGRRGAV